MALNGKNSLPPQDIEEDEHFHKSSHCPFVVPLRFLHIPFLYQPITVVQEKANLPILK
jgi:hypothetical protein